MYGYNSGEKYKVLLLYGEEKLLQQRTLRYYEEEYLNPDFVDFNLHEFEGKATRERDVIAACETLPLMDEKQVVIVREVMEFIEENNNISKEFRAFIKELPEHVLLIFTEDQIPVNGKFGFIKFLKKIKAAVEFKPLTPQEFRKFIKAELKAYGGTADNRALAYFTKKSKYFNKKSDTDLYTVVNELKKIVDYAEDGVITEKDIDENYTDILDENIFDFIDALTMKQTEKALRSYEKIRDEAHLFQILAMVNRQVRLLLHTKLLLEQGAGEGELRKKLGVPPFLVGKLKREQRGFSENFLREFYQYLADTDIGIKTGRIPETGVIENIILRFTKEKV